MTGSLSADLDRRLIAGVIVVGVALRYVVSARGHNFDFDSFRIVADISHAGGTVYSETERYNYGPVWAWLLHACEALARWVREPDVFRWSIIAVLTGADLAIAAILRSRCGDLVAALFFLNPVSIIITGYHNQFDNLAIATGLLGVVWLEKRSPATSWRRQAAPLLLIGLSLAIKHVLVLLPLWLALREREWSRRALVLLLPLAALALSFVPYLHAREGIVDNVINYRSFENGLYTSLVPAAVEQLLSPTVVLVAGLVAVGWLSRTLERWDQALLYLGVLLVLSPALANQYLAIPMAAVVAWLNPAFLLYAAAATGILLIRPDGLHIQRLIELAPDRAAGDGVYAYAVALLAGGLVWRQRRVFLRVVGR